LRKKDWAKEAILHEGVAERSMTCLTTRWKKGILSKTRQKRKSQSNIMTQKGGSIQQKKGSSERSVLNELGRQSSVVKKKGRKLGKKMRCCDNKEKGKDIAAARPGPGTFPLLSEKKKAFFPAYTSFKGKKRVTGGRGGEKREGGSRKKELAERKSFARNKIA